MPSIFIGALAVVASSGHCLILNVLCDLDPWQMFAIAGSGSLTCHDFLAAACSYSVTVVQADVRQGERDGGQQGGAPRVQG